MEKHKQAPKLLRLDLQNFAEEIEEVPEGGSNTEGTPAEGEETPNQAKETPTDDKVFTQAQVDAIISDRLARERKKSEDAQAGAKAEAERQRLEEAEQYKELAESYKADLEALRGDALKAKKESALIKAGYTGEQVTRYLRYLDGETDEDIAASIETLKADIPPKKKTYVDPSVNNGESGKPSHPDASDYGRELFDRAFGKK